MTRDWDIDWEYWDAQVEGYKQSLRKPLWRDYLQTQKEKMDKVHDFFWESNFERGGETRREEESDVPVRHAGKKLSPPVPPVNTSE